MSAGSDTGCARRRTAYAVWTGIGAVGAAITGILLLGESASPARLLSLGLIVAGIIGLKLSTH